MKRISTLSIGIVAYNAETTIRVLLDTLLAQRYDGLKLREIIVVSDGSNDKTVSQVRALRNRKIKLVVRRKRLGVSHTLNEITSHARGDALVLLTSDVLPMHESFLKELIKPLQRSSKVGLTSGHIIMREPYSFFESIMCTGHDLRQSIFSHTHQDQGMYLCHRQVRALRKSFYKNIIWPENCPDDAYSYFLCKKLGYQFSFAPHAGVLVHIPLTFQQYRKENHRFTDGKARLMLYFPRAFVRNSYQISVSTFFPVLFRFFLTRPVTSIAYGIMYLAAKYLTEKDIIDHSFYTYSTPDRSLRFEYV